MIEALPSGMTTQALKLFRIFLEKQNKCTLRKNDLYKHGRAERNLFGEGNADLGLQNEHSEH